MRSRGYFDRDIDSGTWDERRTHVRWTQVEVTRFSFGRGCQTGFKVRSARAWWVVNRPQAAPARSGMLPHRRSAAGFRPGSTGVLEELTDTSRERLLRDTRVCEDFDPRSTFSAVRTGSCSRTASWDRSMRETASSSKRARKVFKPVGSGSLRTHELSAGRSRGQRHMKASTRATAPPQRRRKRTARRTRKSRDDARRPEGKAH